MATKRYLTNDYHDLKVVKLDASASRSPVIVTQEGCSPDDPHSRTHLFYLQRDGQWIDEIARSTRPDHEAGEIVFEDMSDAVQLLGTLFGKPRVRAIPTTDA